MLSVFTTNPATSIHSVGEQALLRLIRTWLGETAPACPEGMGDDCAVLPAAEARPNLITVDALVYGQHFDDTVPVTAVGAKLLKRNLSDIAAMGGIAQSAVVSLILAPETSVEFLEAFTRGLADCALEHGVKIVGGDLTEAPGFFGGTLTLLGHAERAVTRQGGQVGDWIGVTGPLGGSLLGHHYTFTPRMREGTWLARQPELRGMMDVTDGLAKDLPALLPAESAAALNLGQIPIADAAKKLEKQGTLTALEHALTDGEDYELLFTLDQNTDPVEFAKRYSTAFSTPISVIGKIIHHDGTACLLDATTKLSLAQGKGYEHFGKID